MSPCLVCKDSGKIFCPACKSRQKTDRLGCIVCDLAGFTDGVFTRGFAGERYCEAVRCYVCGGSLVVRCFSCRGTGNWDRPGTQIPSRHLTG